MNHCHLFVARTGVRRLGIWCLALFAASLAANAQFKVVGPAPFPPAAARQQIRALLEGVVPSNRQQTIDKLTGLLAWYRDILDEELIAAWKKDTRANLTEVMESLADSRVASQAVEFSWREQRPAAFDLAYAPMFAHLMARFPESAQPFLDDLLTNRPTPELSEPEAEAVSRILLDMPDIGTWRNSALADPASLPPSGPNSAASGFARKRPGAELPGTALAGRSQNGRVRRWKRPVHPAQKTDAIPARALPVPYTRPRAH